MTAGELVQIIKEATVRQSNLTRSRLAAALWNCSRQDFMKGVGGGAGQDIAAQAHNAATIAIALWDRPEARTRWIIIAIALIEHLEEAASEPLVGATSSIFVRGITQCQALH